MIKITTDWNIKENEWFDVMQRTRFRKLIFPRLKKKKKQKKKKKLVSLWLIINAPS